MRGNTKLDKMEFPKEPVISDSADNELDAPSRISETDIQAIAEAVYEKLKNESLCSTPKEVLTYKELKAINKDMCQYLSAPWQQTFGAMAKLIMRLHGLKPVDGEDGKLKIMSIYPPPQQSPVSAELTQTAVTPISTPWWNSLLVKLRETTLRVKADAASCFWKSVAYYVAILSFAFGCSQWYEQRQLKKVAQKYELFKTYYNIFPEHKEIYDNVNANIEKHGIEHIMQQVNKLKAEKELEEMRKQSKRRNQ